MSTPTVLSLNASEPRREESAGWTADTFVLSAAARGVDQVRQRVPVAPGDVLELELANGLRLLVAAEDAGRYLGATQARGGPGTEAHAHTLLVGPTLRLSGQRLPPATARDGVGAWVLKALKVYKSGPVGMTALAAAGAFQDSQLDHREGLFRLSPDRWALTPVAALPASAEPALLFLHGTASSCEGSFGSLWGGDQAELDARAELRRLYGERLYGFEHRSLTDSPVANVLALVKQLPKGARLHLVSHSRGGMLGELLARANRMGADPFTEADIQRFLQQAQRTGRQGCEADADRLRELNRAMKARNLRIERFVRVAATARGTTLASGRLDRWATVMLNLLGKGLAAVPGLQPIATGYDLLQNFVRAVVKERTDARILPGLEAMMPDSPLVALLNAPDVELDASLHVIAGDYAGDGLLAWLGDCLSQTYYGSPTDLVVNTPSMSGGAVRRQGIWLKPLSGPAVHHLSYFRRRESAQSLLDALAGSNTGFERLAAPSRTVLARGGKHVLPRETAPIALMLPGIMGSHLARGSHRIWFDPVSMAAGQMERLTVDAAGVSADGWLDLSYEAFAQHLAQTHELRPFAYDWRLSIVQAAEQLGPVLDQALAEARQRQQPLHIVAHSMGGLVARLALKGRWDALKALPGSRLVQFGTPNGGSHSIAAVLLGRDGFVQKIERWADWRHDMNEFLQIVSAFPGVLELLPWPGKDGKALDGLDYFDARLWQQWHEQDAENPRRHRGAGVSFEQAKGAGDGWVLPTQAALDAARQAVLQIQAAPLDPACTLYVGGRDRTPVAIKLIDGQVQIGWSGSGDGRVPWQSGCPSELKAWFVDAAHGNLLDHRPAFDQYVSLLLTGDCTLPTSIGPRSAQAGAAGSDAGIEFVAAPRQVDAIYPSAEELMAAALGATLPPVRPAGTAQQPVQVSVVHGSLAGADTPVLIGAYANDPLGGTAKFLDRHLGGSLQRAQNLGRYPDHPGRAMVFLPARPGLKPGGAVVVGLGAVGELQPGELSRALLHGLLEYARVWAQLHPAEASADAAAGDVANAPRPVSLSTLLVGTGYGGLGVALGMRAQVEALCRANHLLEQSGMDVRIGALCLFEEEESRAIAAASALRELAADAKFADVLRFDGRISLGQGRYLGRQGDARGGTGWQRVHITQQAQGTGLRFTLVTDRARNEVNEEPDQRQAVDGLIRSATVSTQDQPGLSRALFELMVPNAFKGTLSDMRGLILGVDASAAAYPWELMRDEAEQFDAPLAARVGLIRQLASPYGQRRVATVEQRRVLVVGDTQSGLPELPGAQQEADEVAQLFDAQAYQVNQLDRPDGQTVLVNLFDGQYRALHLAAHGAVAEDGQGPTGMVLGPNTYLTTAQISKLRRVPELVFLNCCHLGSMAPDARPRWGQLAANLATEFIEMGCKAVVAAGWAVDDGAAETFATTFWRRMLDGDCFGDAVLAARGEAYRRHPQSNTWGAYQAYGDERFQLQRSAGDSWQAPDYLLAGQVLGDLEQLQARIGPADSAAKELYRGRLEKIEQATQARFFQATEVRERLASIWADLGDKPRAVEHYRAALAQADGQVSLRSLEQLANLEIRLGVEQLGQPGTRRAGGALMKAGQQRLKALIGLGATPERLALLGSSWKRCATARLASPDTDAMKEVAEMLKAYEAASDLSLEQGDERDYYPTLNVLDGAIVLAALGERSAFERLAPVQADWLAQSVRNGQRRYARERDFFHAYAEVEAARVDALWAMLDGRTRQALSQKKVRDELAQRHRDLLDRLGNERLHDSVLQQLHWLAAQLPAQGEHRPLRRAVEQLLQAVGG